MCDRVMACLLRPVGAALWLLGAPAARRQASCGRAVSCLLRTGDYSPREIPSAARMAVTARASSKRRSPGAAIVASTRAPRPARRTIPCSFSAHSAPDELPPGRLDAALASSPAQVTTSWRSAAASAMTSEKAALRRQRAGATRRSASRNSGPADSPASPPQGELAGQHVTGHPAAVALRPVDRVPASPPIITPAPDGVEVAIQEIDAPGPPP